MEDKNIWDLDNFSWGNDKWNNEIGAVGHGYDYYKEYKWYSKEATNKLSKWDIINQVEKLIKKDSDNINSILDTIPEEEIQKYLRAKKMAKIKRNAK